MKLFKTIFIFLFASAIFGSAIAKVTWDEATLVDQKILSTAGAENIFECSYQLVVGGSYRMSIRYKGFICPQSILINVESNKWKERR